MEGQVENAIQIAANPTSSQELRGQAIEYLNQLRAEGSAWQAALTLFARDPRPTDFVRHTSLDLVNNAIQEHRLDEQSLAYIKDTLMGHIHRSYVPGSGAADTSHIQNKLMQTVTYLFVALYPSSWQSFFDDFRALAGDQSTIGNVNTATTLLYLRMLGQVHDEIADQLVARPEDEKKRNTELKDLIRQRDAQKISLSWQEILAKWRETDLNLVKMCLETIGRWVSWTDINLIVNQAMITTFLEMAGQQGIADPESAAGKVRDAAIDTFSEIVGKKMSPSDKIELITFLNLSEVVGQLISSPALADFNSSNYDNDLAETVAKLVNNIVFDIVKILENEAVEEHVRQRADDLIRIFTPYLLRFFADQYDEVCSTVIPSLTDLLTFLRKLQKKSGSIPPQYAAVLPPVLDAIIAKMKYDETASWGEEGEQTDEAEFLDLRRRLHVLQQTVTAIDEPYYIETLSRLVNGTFGRLSQGDQSLNWRDLELALYEMYLFGELAVRNQGLYAKREPSSAAAQQLVNMMNSMVESGLASYPHPAVQLQYMEICVRYYQFFEQNPGLIPKVLENFVNLTHSNHVKVRSRSWYLFQRLVKHLRAQLGNVSYDIIQAVGDLLAIKAELPDTSEDEMSSDEEDQSADALFDSQLYLFEAVGCIASSNTVSAENKRLYAQTIMSPLFSDMQQTLPQARNGDERAILQIHHIIMAIGTLARGYSDWVPSNNNSVAPQSEVADEFVKASEAILVAVESLNSSGSIRHAARFAFSRMIAVLGSRLLQQLPSWIEGLLSLSSSMDEISTFLKVLGQVVFTFKSEIAGILDTVMSPVLQRIFTALAVVPSGTDDEIQLAELRREYLNFIVVVLNQGLGSVFVSNVNQATFDKLLAKDVAKEKLTENEATGVRGRVRAIGELNELRDVDLVIEAVAEKLSLKQTIFSQLASICKPSTILASNTSSISLTKIAASAINPNQNPHQLASPDPSPSRVVGLHFFNPVPVMSLVELIAALQTSEDTLKRAREFAARCGKVVTVSKDTPGFISNRVLMPMINEAIICLEEGVATREDIDQTMKRGTNVPMGPLTLADFIGLDTCLSIMQVLYSQTSDSKYRPSVLLSRMVDAGWLGKKVGKGFYEYGS